MRISRLTFEDFKAVREQVVTINEDARYVEFAGPTGHGKTTVLEAVESLLFGIHPDKIRPGADEASVTGELTGDENVKIKRTRHVDGSQEFTIRVNGGKPEKRPAEWLREHLGVESIDPLALLDGKRIKDEILNLLGITVTVDQVAERAGVKPEELPGNVDWQGGAVDAIDKARGWFAAQRTEAGRTLKAKAAVLADQEANLPPVRPAPAFAVEDLDAAEAEAREALAVEQGKSGALDGAFRRLAQVEDAERAARNKIAGLEDDLARQQAALASLQDEREHLAIKVQQSGPDKAAMDAAQAQLKIVAERRMEIREHEAAESQREAVGIVRQEHAIAKARWDTLDARVKALGPDYVSDLLAASGRSVPGLTWDGEHFRLNGTLVSELSSGEKIRMSVRLAKLKGAGLKLFVVDGIEKLSTAHREALAEEIDDDPDLHLWTAKTDDLVSVTGAEVEVRA